VSFRLLAALVAAVVVAAGCGTVRAGHGSATLWVTRDQGAKLVFAGTVPAGLTVIEALERKTKVETSYGGRFVQAIDEIAGNKTAEIDWFYYVNGREADVGAAEENVRPGDIVWWDYRSWKRQMDVPAVVGAFPDPFLRGWDGHHHPVVLRYPPALSGAARALRRLFGSGGGGAANSFVLAVAPRVLGAVLTASGGASSDSPTSFRLIGSRTAVLAAASALAHDPAIVRFRYTARFDARGQVVG